MISFIPKNRGSKEEKEGYSQHRLRDKKEWPMNPDERERQDYFDNRRGIESDLIAALARNKDPLIINPGIDEEVSTEKGMAVRESSEPFSKRIRQMGQNLYNL